MTVLIWLLTAVHIVVALFLIILVLMQKSNEQGVGAAFGGGVTETVFGGGTTSALVRITVWCAGIMLGTTLILAVLHSHRGSTQGTTVMERALKSGAIAPTSPAAPGIPVNPQAPTLPVPPVTPSSEAAPATPAVEQAQPAATPAKP